MKPLSIVFVTGRKEPRSQWFVDGLCNQVSPDQRPFVEVIFIDGKLWPDELPAEVKAQDAIAWGDPQHHDRARREALADIVRGRFEYKHLPPKPTVMQGPFKLTQKDWFCASNSRNSGFVAARHPSVAFCDDLAVLGDQWFSQAMHASDHGYACAGVYCKRKKVAVENGRLAGFEHYPEGVDSRWPRTSDTGIVAWHGSGIFGCSFIVPLELALTIDGFERACDGSGLEDCDFGIRLERAGARVFINRNFFTTESEEDHHTEDFKGVGRMRRMVTRDRLPEGYDRYVVPNEAEKYWSDHVLLNRVINETSRVTPVIGDNLRALRDAYHANGKIPIPHQPTTDWRDGTPLAEL